MTFVDRWREAQQLIKDRADAKAAKEDLRDRFAMAALPLSLQHGEFENADSSAELRKQVAAEAYRWADAMLAARAKAGGDNT